MRVVDRNLKPVGHVELSFEFDTPNFGFCGVVDIQRKTYDLRELQIFVVVEESTRTQSHTTIRKCCLET